MQWARCGFTAAFLQFVVKITQPIIGPALRRIIPPMGPIDSASLLLVAFILSVIKAIVLLFKVITFQAIILDCRSAHLQLQTIGLLIFWVLVMAIAGWVSES